MRCAENLRVQAYFDGELDALAAVDVERHAQDCPECGALLKDLQALRTRMRRELPYVQAPPELRTRIGRALDGEAAVAPQARPRARAPWRARAFWLGALGGVGASALAGSLAFVLLLPALTEPTLEGLVTAHVRSLMSEHLTDVLSTDRHTVKPWFAGHADVSPVVADFAAEGYRLVGGRADYLEHQRAAVLVYQHGAHFINVFSWAAERHALPNRATRDGYHMVFWKVGDLQYCAVSDAGWDELLALTRLLQDLGTRDTRE